MRQYWIRLGFSDPNRRTDPKPVSGDTDAGTLEAAALGRVVERVTYRQDDQAAIEYAQRWLRLHRNAAQDAPRFDRWTVIATSPQTHLPRTVASGGTDGD